MLVDALRDMVFDGHYEQIDAPVRTAVASLSAPVGSDLTYAQRARQGYDQLREVTAILGPARAILAQPQKLFSLFEWSAINATDLVPLLSGHFTLTIGGIQRLGTGTPRQLEQLALLDDAGHVGVFLLTELGYGSNVLEMETEAVWDQRSRHFLLTTPHGAACKFMPNVAADDVPKLTVVAARLKVGGKDEGIFPFIVPLRCGGTTAPGVEVVALPDKGFVPMDNAMIRFNRVVLPYDAWLSGGMARIEDDGTFFSAVPVRQRFQRTIAQLQTGRVALSCAAVAMARAGLSLTARYATRRRTAGGVTMLERDNVQRDLASCVARVYAITALNNAVRGRFADPSALPEQNALLTMLAKPLLSGTALAVLQECRERCGAQGMFRVNRIPDYIGNVQGAITAEGDNQVLQVAAGRMLVRLRGVPGALPTLTNGAGPRVRPWWYDLLLAREQALAATAAPVNGTPPTTTAIGPNCHAMDLAAATADRLAADALYTAAWSAAPCAREPLETLADVYALEKIESQAAWYTAAGCLTPERAGEMQRRLAASYRALAAHLPSLVDAFAIPALAAPIEGDYITAWLESAGWNDIHDPTEQPQIPQPRVPEQRTPEQRTPEQRTPEQRTPEQRTPEHWTLEQPTSEHRPLDQRTLVPRNGSGSGGRPGPKNGAPPLEPSSSPGVSPSLTTGSLQNGSRPQNGTSPQNGSRSPGTSVSPPSQETSPATSATPTPTP